jgi:hypothetical protein
LINGLIQVFQIQPDILLEYLFLPSFLIFNRGLQ